MKACLKRCVVFGLFSASVFLTSCSTLEMVEEKYEPEKGGVVRFDNSDESRKEAQGLAQKFCRGPVKIQMEGSEFIPSQRPTVALDQEESAAMDDVSEASSVSKSEDAPVLNKDAESTVKGSKEASILYMKFRCAVQGRKASGT